MQDSRAKKLQNEKLSDDDIPSAPPFCGSAGEIKQEAEQLQNSREHYAPHAADFRDFSVKNGAKTSESVPPQVKPQDGTGQKMSDASVRSVKSFANSCNCCPIFAFPTEFLHCCNF